MAIEYGLKTELFQGGPSVIVTYSRQNLSIDLKSVLTNGRADRCLLEDLTLDIVMQLKKRCADDRLRVHA